MLLIDGLVQFTEQKLDDSQVPFDDVIRSLEGVASLPKDAKDVALLPRDVPEPVGQRIDGNSIPAAMLARQVVDIAPAGLEKSLWEIRLAIPNILWPGKLDTPVAQRGAKDVFREHYQLTSPPFPQDFLVTQQGSILGYAGIVGLLFGGLLLGSLYGAIDALIGRRKTVIPIIAGLGLLVCALSYELTLFVYATTARTVLILATVWSVSVWLQKWRSKTL
jgi:hypothetical protein